MRPIGILWMLVGGLMIGWGGLLFAAEPVFPSVTQSEVAFPSGRLSIAGTLLVPVHKGQVPGVVVVHGSGNSDRSNPWTRAYADALAARGIAVLHPDKRGCGSSEGDWRRAGMEDFAEDAIAGLRHLRSVASVDRSRVGLIGFSQGGQVVPLAASRSPEVRFVISVSGSVVPMAEQMVDEVIMSAERAGLAGAEIARIRELHDLAFRFLESEGDEDWATYMAKLNALAAGEPKGKALIERFPKTRDHPALEHLRKIKDFDPVSYWRNLAIPVLFVYGGNDTQIRTTKSIDRIQTQLPGASANYAVLLFSRNGHALFREDLNDCLARWIRDRGEH